MKRRRKRRTAGQDVDALMADLAPHVPLLAIGAVAVVLIFLFLPKQFGTAQVSACSSCV